MFTNKFAAVACLALSGFSSSLSAATAAGGLSPCGIILPQERVDASPASELATVNPPPLLWPIKRGNDVRYAVRLSKDEQFSSPETIRADGLRWAMFNPHVKLLAGKWFWQYGVTGDRGGPTEWSKTFEFTIGEDARMFVTPAAKLVVTRAISAARPRVLIAADQLNELRGRWAGSPVASEFIGRADRYLDRPLPDVEAAKPSQQGKTAYETKNFAKWASKAYAADVLEAVEWLVPAYLLTGDDRYGKSAVRYGLFTASLDPDGVTSPKVSDFADGSCMRALALVYDSCHSLLGEAERARMRQAMAARAKRWFDGRINRLESQVWNAHTWQHILLEATEVALATVGELPEAEQWLAYSYEVWTNRFPLAGGNDGGWAEGVGYLGSNLDTLLAMPSLWTRLSGVDYFAIPWYRQAADFHLYTWPPRSVSDGFGDGTERGDVPSKSRGTFMRGLGSCVDNPYAIWYAEQLRATEDGLSAGALLEWRRLAMLNRKAPLAASPAALPQARAFRDVGVVSMHTNLARAENDVMLGFRSSPYGAYNHAHACQNAFNLNLGGKRLFANSGYYIAYGDDHFKGWYTQTRAHNSVLIDGKGQIGGTEGYGWVARFADSRPLSYTMGDASCAYGDAGLSRFRRHVVLIRPSTVIVYDDLAADHRALWSWLLHSPAQISGKGQRVTARVSTGSGQADLFGSCPLKLAIDTRFDPPAVNWRNKSADGKVAAYPDQWHATFESTEKAPAMRFLAVIQLRLRRDERPLAKPVVDEQGLVRLGGWKILAQLDAARPAALVVERGDGQIALLVDTNKDLSSRTYDVPADAALFVENGAAKPVVSRWPAIKTTTQAGGE